MDDHGATHGAEHGHGAHGPEIWETSIWPVIAALGAIITGLTLVWMAKDTESAFAGPLAGASLVATVFSVAAWIWERRQKAEEAATGMDVDAPNPRFTQVITFTVAPGQLERARSGEGVIRAVEAPDLAAIKGYQDLRVTVAPSDDGPSQVLVETTWEGRDGLANYNASRDNLLDVIAQHEDQVVPGTVQAFDMEVVRDTKRQSYRFGFPAGVAVLGGLLVGGFAFGAAQTIFEDEAAVIEGPGPVEDPYEIVASDNAFNKSTLTAPPNTEVTFTMPNEGVNPHNLTFYVSRGGEQIATTGNPGPDDGTVTFTTPDAGSYYFQCDAHPDQMNGTFEVVEGAPPPGGASGGPSGPGGPTTVTMVDNDFEPNTLEATAGQPFTINVVNDGAAQHNIRFMTEEGGEQLTPESVSDIIAGGETTEVTFTPPEAGTFFFYCEVHPNEMTGELTVAEGSGAPEGEGGDAEGGGEGEEEEGE